MADLAVIEVTSTVVGVDDCALRKGQRYATILVDREEHRIIGLMPDRQSVILSNLPQDRCRRRIIRLSNPAITVCGAASAKTTWIEFILDAYRPRTLRIVGPTSFCLTLILTSPPPIVRGLSRNPTCYASVGLHCVPVQSLRFLSP